MADITFETNAEAVAASLAAVPFKAGARIAEVTRLHGQLLLTTVRRNASLPRSGPPGPRLQTGDYVRSWNLRTDITAGTVTATVGTDRPQGRRLEYGFVGPDALGRVYHQPPYPHAGPALDEIAPLYAAAIAKSLDGIL